METALDRGRGVSAQSLDSALFSSCRAFRIFRSNPAEMNLGTLWKSIYSGHSIKETVKEEDSPGRNFISAQTFIYFYMPSELNIKLSVPPENRSMISFAPLLSTQKYLFVCFTEVDLLHVNWMFCFKAVRFGMMEILFYRSKNVLKVIPICFYLLKKLNWERSAWILVG